MVDPSITLAFYGGLIAISFIVVLLTGNLVYYRVRSWWKHGHHLLTDNFILALALFLTYLAIFKVRDWFWVWKYFKDGCPVDRPDCMDWMLNHWILLAFISIYYVAGLLVVRVLTKEKTGEMGWLLSGVFMTTVMIANYLYF